MKNSIKRAQSQACLGFAERKNFRPLAKLKKLSLTLVLLITAVAGAWAQGPWTSGSCTVTLSNGTLTVSGNGAMADYEFFSDRPWHNNINDITSVVVESGVTTVGKYAFFNFANMTSVTLPEGLTAIGVNAFRVCGKLTSVTIPSTVTSIGKDAFYNCAGMTDVNLYAAPADLTWDENNDFKENKATKCHVFAEHLTAYQTKFGSSVNVTFVGDLQPLPGTMNLNSDKTTASFTMPANDVTVNYTLVRDLEDQTNKVTFSGLPTTTTAPIIVKKGDDGKYQPAEALTIQLNDALISGDDKNIIAATGLTVTVEKKGDGNTWTSSTLADFLADMQPGTYKLKAVPKDETSPYEGTVTTSEFTVVEQYDLTVKPANDFSKNGLENVTVGSETIAPNADGKASKTGVAPNTEVKVKAKRGYIIDKVEAKKGAAGPSLSLTSPVVGQVIGSDGKNYAAGATLPDGVNKVAMIAYLSGSNGLAIALADESSMNWATAKSTCEAKTPAFTNGTWKLPSQDEWKQMFGANGGNDGSYTGLNTALAAAGGDSSKLLEGSAYYWSSLEYDPGVSAYYVNLDSGSALWNNNYEINGNHVRACLAF